MSVYRNAEEAFVSELGHIDLSGRDVHVRGSITRELTARSFTITHPRERCISVQGRLNNIVATVAETVWVLAGRNDLEFLGNYLPRAAEFSDDGSTWRAGYGPRLRAWHGVDQLAQVVKVLREDPLSRRAVMSLFDPAVDFDETKDVPCNNWVHFLQRDGRLDMSIAVRSNDVIWGFSGINAFEWSVVQEVVAQAIDATVGVQHWMISSMHLYERHLQQATQTLRRAPGTGVYDRGASPVPYDGAWADLDRHLAQWFAVESMIREGSSDAAKAVEGFPEPMLRAFLRMVLAHWLLQAGDVAGATSALEPIADTDLGLAMSDLITRRARVAEGSESTPAADTAEVIDLKAALRALHRRKNAAYGDSWKRRGELMGVLANVARKVDRLANTGSTHTDDPEQWTDTVADLGIYLIKYMTFLADADAAVADLLFAGSATGKWSDDVTGFERLLANLDPEDVEPRTGITRLADAFDRLETGVRKDDLTSVQRADLVAAMAAMCLGMLLHRPASFA